MSAHPRPFYYLENFQRALEWLRVRYDDLLVADERSFIERFFALPRESAALLARLVSRRGPMFRTCKRWQKTEDPRCPSSASGMMLAAAGRDARLFSSRR